MHPPPPRDDLRFSNTTGIMKKKSMWFIGVEVEQETSAPPPKKIVDPPLQHISYASFTFNRDLIELTKLQFGLR